MPLGPDGETHQLARVAVIARLPSLRRQVQHYGARYCDRGAFGLVVGPLGRQGESLLQVLDRRRRESAMLRKQFGRLPTGRLDLRRGQLTARPACRCVRPGQSAGYLGRKVSALRRRRLRHTRTGVRESSSPARARVPERSAPHPHRDLREVGKHHPSRSPRPAPTGVFGFATPYGLTRGTSGGPAAEGRGSRRHPGRRTRAPARPLRA
jgi:hypothetical protein